MSKQSPQQIAQNMLLLGEFEDYPFEDFLAVLKAADDLYYNDAESFLSDIDYDALRLYAEGLNPHHSYFTGVGSEVRGGKVKLPYPMGSLDQVYEGEVEKWVRKWNLEPAHIVISDKLDGVSALVLYDGEGDLQIAYSRGDGTMGADITRHVKHLVPSNVGEAMVIRGEIIISKAKWPGIRTLVKSRSGQPYKNARNMTAGLMNAKENPLEIYPHIDFVAYGLIDIKPNAEHNLSKSEQLLYLKEKGFEIPHFDMFKGDWLCDRVLSRHLEMCKIVAKYEIDGVVIEVEDSLLRFGMRPTRDTLNPAYAVKYKVADADNVAIATVKKVHWNVSKHGYLKPRVEICPVDLVGVTIRHATGFNAQFIHDNSIGPDAQIEITRSGDVIPFIRAVVKGTTAQMPEGNWVWNDTGVDAVRVDHEVLEEVMIQQCVAFFSAIDVPHLKEGNIRKMFELHTYHSFYHAALSMMNNADDHWVSCIGANGIKIYEGLRKKLNGIPLFILMGATPFFGRGVGSRKFKKLLTDLQVKSVDELSLINKAQIVSVEGFEDKTASKIVAGMNHFLLFMEGINDLRVEVQVEATDGALKNQRVVFTGFRDKELQALVESEGGTMQSGVSGKTTILVAKNPESNSGKMKKARDLGIRIMGIDEFKEIL